MWNDLRLAVRALGKAPVFSAAAIGTLSLGIAASTAIFSLYYQVLLRSLPVRAPERLVLLHSPDPGLPGRSCGQWRDRLLYPMYRSLRDGASRAIALAARSSATVEIVRSMAAIGCRPKWYRATSSRCWALMQYGPECFQPSEDRVPGRDAVAVLSFPYWMNTLVAMRMPSTGKFQSTVTRSSSSESLRAPSTAS